MKVKIGKLYSIILLLIMFIGILVLRMFDYRVETYLLCGLLMLFYFLFNQQYIYTYIPRYGLKFFVFFAFLMIITLICVIDSKTRLSFFYQIVLFFLFYIFFSIFFMKNGESSYHWLFLPLYKGAILLSFAGIYEGIIRQNLFQNFIYSNYFAYAEHTELYRISLMFIHPIVYAHFIMIMLIYGCYFDKSKYKLINCTLLLINIYLTKARSIWVAIVLVAFIYLMKQSNIQKYKIKKGTLICLLSAPIILVFVNYTFLKKLIVQGIVGRITESFSTNSYILRVSAINNLMEYFFNDNTMLGILFGSGNGAATVMMEDVVSVQGIGQYSMTTTDNFYLSFLYNFGIITFLILLIYIFGVFKKTLVANNKMLEYIGVSLIGSIISIFFYDIFNWEVIIYLIICQIALYNMISLQLFDKETKKKCTY